MALTYSKTELTLLRRDLYNSKILVSLDRLAYLLTWTTYTCFDQCISCFLPTTGEQNRPYLRIPHLLLLPWIYLAMGVLASPLAVLGSLLNKLLVKFRAPYRYHEGQVNKNPQKQLNYSFATANVCLGPEILCRWNNLGNNTWRARKMAQMLAHQQTCYAPVNNNQNGFLGGGVQQVDAKPSKLGTSLSFPALDIIVFQEVFDAECARILIEELSPVFPYIIYDAATRSVRKKLNSGLMIASKHEITDADYCDFEESLGFHKGLSTGVLMCKVCLGRDPRTGRLSAGYIATTHLQPYCGDSPIVRHQLTKMYQFVSAFRAKTRERWALFQGKGTRACEEHVMFDVIAGDLNFDNMSPADYERTNHPIFTQYTDVARVQPGIDRNWAVGTERRHRTLHDEDASHAHGLKAILDDPTRRPLYFPDADIPKGCSEDPWAMPPRDEFGDVLENPMGGRRRVDYVLYNNEDSLVVTGYNFVTSFASLTDHVPVAMTIMAPQL